MNHLFILCYGRTGSTVVQNLLNSLDGYCIKGERKGVLNCFATAANRVRSDIESFSESDISRRQRSPHYGISEVNADEFDAALASVYREQLLKPPAGTRVVGTKDVSMDATWMSDLEFANLITFILRAFENPRIVFLTRNHTEVRQSGWWRDMSAHDVENIITCTDRRFRDANSEHPEQTFILDYSEFKDSEEGLRRLLDWLGEDYDEEVITAISNDRLMHMKAAPKEKSFSQKVISRFKDIIR